MPKAPGSFPPNGLRFLTSAFFVMMLGVIFGGRIGYVLIYGREFWALDPWYPFKITQGGLGIPGGIFLGVLTGLVVVKVKKLPALDLLDVVAPALPVAQAIGRFGNWFNQELYGQPTDLPWGLEIDPAHRAPGFEEYATFHPTFLYESLWCVLVALIVIWADKRFQLGHGRAFALYVFAYCVGRLVFELVRIDNATLILGVRVNVFTSILVAIAAAVYFVISAIKSPGREASVYREPTDREPQPVPV